MFELQIGVQLDICATPRLQRILYQNFAGISALLLCLRQLVTSDSLGEGASSLNTHWHPLHTRVEKVFKRSVGALKDNSDITRENVKVSGCWI